MTKSLTYLLTFLLFTIPAFSQDAGVRKKHFNHKGGLALQGYDPVSYQSGGPKKGNSSFSHAHNGVTYRFTSDANRKKFIGNTAKYEPAFGGWCAWAMIDGDKVKINPKSYKVINGKTHLFYDGFLGDTRKQWNAKKDDQGQSAKAQAKWQGIIR